MLVLRPRPSTKNPPEPAISGGCAAGSSLERNPRPSMGWKRRDPDHCIGLGIVAALEKVGFSEAPPAASLMVGASHVSAPIAISGPRSAAASFGRRSPHGSGRDTAGFFCVSPPASEDGSPAEFRVADFLSQCNLCRKRLHGRDIYMYRGEKAFCSMECRYQQIVSDEFSEKYCWSTGATKKTSADAPASPACSGDGRFFLIPGIAAA